MFNSSAISEEHYLSLQNLFVTRYFFVSSVCIIDGLHLFVVLLFFVVQNSISNTRIVPPLVVICNDLNVMSRPYLTEHLAILHKFFNKFTNLSSLGNCA